MSIAKGQTTPSINSTKDDLDTTYVITRATDTVRKLEGALSMIGATSQSSVADMWKQDAFNLITPEFKAGQDDKTNKDITDLLTLIHLHAKMEELESVGKQAISTMKNCVSKPESKPEPNPEPQSEPLWCKSKNDRLMKLRKLRYTKQREVNDLDREIEQLEIDLAESRRRRDEM